MHDPILTMLSSTSSPLRHASSDGAESNRISRSCQISGRWSAAGRPKSASASDPASDGDESISDYGAVAGGLPACAAAARGQYKGIGCGLHDAAARRRVDEGGVLARCVCSSGCVVVWALLRPYIGIWDFVGPIQLSRAIYTAPGRCRRALQQQAAELQ